MQAWRAQWAAAAVRLPLHPPADDAWGALRGRLRRRVPVPPGLPAPPLEFPARLGPRTWQPGEPFPFALAADAEFAIVRHSRRRYLLQFPPAPPDGPPAACAVGLLAAGARAPPAAPAAAAAGGDGDPAGQAFAAFWLAAARAAPLSEALAARRALLAAVVRLGVPPHEADARLRAALA